MEMEPSSQAARLFEWLSNFELSHAQLPEIAASGNERSPEVILAANKPLAQPLSTTAGTMVLKARSPDMDTLGKPMVARILATKGYRLKSEQRLLLDECEILRNLRRAESRVHEAARPLSLYSCTARYEELIATLKETIEKLGKVAHQLDRFENEALPQATFSVWGTEMTLLERSHITKALEPQVFKDGAVLIKQGEPRDAFFIIVQGQVSCTQRRDHRYKVGPAPRRPLLERLRLSAPAVLRPARLCIAARDPEHHQGPLAPRGFERSIRATQAPISRTYTTGPAWTRPCSSKTAC